MIKAFCSLLIFTALLAVGQSSPRLDPSAARRPKTLLQAQSAAGVVFRPFSAFTTWVRSGSPEGMKLFTTKSMAVLMFTPAAQGANNADVSQNGAIVCSTAPAIVPLFVPGV